MLLASIGIGALLGGLTEKQRGGNFLKGAIQGGALGGITGGIGAKFGGGAGGAFGFGTGWKGLLGPAAAIGMGGEMLGQEDANKRMLAGRQRLFDEEEERRIAQLNKMAGYDVSKARLTPETYFASGKASGGLTTLPQYANGGWSRKGYEYGGDVDEVDINVQEMINQPGIEGLGGLEEMEMETASAPNPMAEAFNMFVNEFGREPGSQEELMEFIQQLDIDVPMAAADTEQGMPNTSGRFPFIGGEVAAARGGIMELSENYDEELMMAEGGRVYAKDGLWANIHAKKARIKAGSGEKMRSPGSAGAPTDKALRQSQATGGIADLDMRYGGESMGPGTGTSDDVPAMLSDGEFVVTAEAVKQLGGGDRMEGAKKMYSMMNNLDPASQTPGEMEYVGHG